MPELERSSLKTYTLNVAGDNYSAELVRKKGRRRISIIVYPDNRMEIRAPMRMPEYSIQSFLRQSTSWIQKRLKKNASRPRIEPLLYSEGESIPFLGQELRLTFKKGLRRPTQSDGSLALPESRKGGAYETVEKWYRKEAITIFQTAIERYAPLIGKKPTRFTVRRMRSRWGSCSSKGSLSLNWKILASPQSVVDYLVVHELAHLIEQNHSKRFWAVVERAMPDFRAARKWLKTHGNGILLRFG
ncbi:MAG: M48 family metallopeptidase [Leptospirales bacterium]|nr:M48 family metallopeptidase [Leptospirales bacterium]